ncbi:Hsp20/alpha crystallin family protein [Membranihabitans maritimus]|uniref:Hsp20/alpha crystallin family protein n=1 Tax=Membranihabitans maritimus TaxID=2904244 RepID=UPI001F15ECB1|nr:Hsp20/alpha crystallin family protein [Membranihabitans maritimus]
MSTITKSSQKLSPFFNSFFRDPFWDIDTGLVNTSLKGNDFPLANIKESNESYTIELAAPGKAKEDFIIEVDESKLTIFSEDKKEDEEKNENYTRKEYSYHSFQRSFQLPKSIDIDSIHASYNEGILKIEIPKLQENISNSKTINVS